MTDPVHPTQGNTRFGASALWKQSTLTKQQITVQQWSIRLSACGCMHIMPYICMHMHVCVCCVYMCVVCVACVFVCVCVCVCVCVQGKWLHLSYMGSLSIYPYNFAVWVN